MNSKEMAVEMRGDEVERLKRIVETKLAHALAEMFDLNPRDVASMTSEESVQVVVNEFVRNKGIFDIRDKCASL